MKNFSVKSNGLEFMVSAKDWYEAIQTAYEKYVAGRTSTELVPYMEFRNYCRVDCVK